MDSTRISYECYSVDLTSTIRSEFSNLGTGIIFLSRFSVPLHFYRKGSKARSMQFHSNYPQVQKCFSLRDFVSPLFVLPTIGQNISWI
jgi:hypothetical protein